MVDLLNKLTDADVSYVVKPWGREHCWAFDGGYVKFIVVDEGQRTSRQYHVEKDEVVCIVAGSGTIDGTSDVRYRQPRPSPWYRIEPGRHHRAYGPLKMIEVTTFENDDVVRVSDDYGRGK